MKAGLSMCRTADIASGSGGCHLIDQYTDASQPYTYWPIPSSYYSKFENTVIKIDIYIICLY